MEKMLKNLIIPSIIFILLISLFLIFLVDFNKEDSLIGGDRDSNGCLISAGYSWNSTEKECVREWLSGEERYQVRDFRTCIEAKYPTLKSNPDKCKTPSGRIFENTSQNQERFYCDEESRKGEVCIELYQPVCGWFNSYIECIKYPCAQTYSNSCFACKDSKVDYYTNGECPA